MNRTFDEQHPRDIGNGQFRSKEHAEADIDLLTPAGWESPNEEEDDEFDWVRIDSLMGQDFHLNPARTASLPKMKADDTVAQMTSKVMSYVARTQDLSGMSDETVAESAGLSWSPKEIPDRLRRAFGLPESERIVTAVNASGRPVYLSVGNAFTRTGSFVGGFDTANVAQRIVADRFKERFTAEHPEFTPKEINDLFRRLEDKSYRGKKWAHLWQEAYLPPTDRRTLAAACAPDLVSTNPALTREDLDRYVREMEPAEIRERFSRLPVEEVPGVVDGHAAQVPAYLAKVGPIRQYSAVDAVERHLRGESTYAKGAALNRAYRAFLEEEVAVEYDYQLQRKYVRDNSVAHSATVFEEKKHVPQSYVDAAESSVFRRSGDFSHVELDEDVDLARVGQIEREYARIRSLLPRTGRTPTLRFRKTGRHHAKGVYHPHVDNVAVDPRSPSSFIHEYIHHVDHTAGGRNISSSEEFRPILRAVQRSVDREAGLRAKCDYYKTPTEVLSRTGEAYFSWKGLGGSLNGTAEEYGANPAYVTLEPLKGEIIAFWDALLPALGADRPA
jgi:hypothetical protein